MGLHLLQLILTELRSTENSITIGITDGINLCPDNGLYEIWALKGSVPGDAHIHLVP